MTTPAAEGNTDKPLPPGARVERVEELTPEFARFLYAVVGGPWLWIDRLGWTRRQWLDDLRVPGTETLVATTGGSPVGFVQLQPTEGANLPSVEIRYFGLVESAIGRGLGSALLVRGLEAAWTLAERHPLPATERVWVHTCSLDSPAALTTYRSRGFVVVDETVTQEWGPAEPLGAWRSAGGPEDDRAG